MNYVAGFLIDPTAETVALVRKGKPEWQRGKLNGVGGKIEPGESPDEAMRREFREEAGLDITSWDLFATVDGNWGAVHFFRAFSVATPRTMEAEPIELHKLAAVPYAECIPNLSWLIPLARYTHDYYAPVRASEISFGDEDAQPMDSVRPEDLPPSVYVREYMSQLTGGES